MPTKTKQSSTNNTTVDPWSKAQYTGLANSITGKINQPMQAYTGPMAAGLDPLQSQAMGAAQHNVGVGQGTVQSGVNAAQGVAGYQPQQVSGGMLSGVDMSKYMNPYVDNVVNATNNDIDQQRQRAITQGQGQATQEHAFGGTREGVADSLTNENYGRIAASTDANLRSQGYGEAQNAATSDLNRGLSADTANQGASLTGQNLNLSAGGMLGQLGQDQHNMGQSDATLLAGMGSMGQATAQNQDTTAYQEFLRQQGHTPQQIAQMLQLLGATPMTTDQVGTAKSSSFDPMGWAKALAGPIGQAAGGGGGGGGG